MASRCHRIPAARWICIWSGGSCLPPAPLADREVIAPRYGAWGGAVAAHRGGKLLQVQRAALNTPYSTPY